jgi:predicted DNA binding CopG/RHH family protein
VHNYETVVTVARDILKLEGIEKVSDLDILRIFESEIVHKGLIPEKYLRMLKDMMKAKKDYDAGKLSKTDIAQVNKDAREFIRFLIEYMQRKRGRELDRVKIRVKHGNKYGEIIFLDKEAFIIHDIDNEDKEISKAILTPEGNFTNITESSLEELEKAISKVSIPDKTFIKEPIFEHLKTLFGKDVEILINY